MRTTARVATTEDIKGSFIFAAVAVTGGMLLVLLGLLRQML
jgi:hypothetical protein